MDARHIGVFAAAGMLLGAVGLLWFAHEFDEAEDRWISSYLQAQADEVTAMELEEEEWLEQSQAYWEQQAREGNL